MEGRWYKLQVIPIQNAINSMHFNMFINNLHWGKMPLIFFKNKSLDALRAF